MEIKIVIKKAEMNSTSEGITNQIGQAFDWLGRSCYCYQDFVVYDDEVQHVFVAPTKS